MKEWGFNEKEAFKKIIDYVIEKYPLNLSEIKIKLSPKEQATDGNITTNAIWAFDIETKDMIIVGHLDNISGYVFVTSEKQKNIKQKNFFFSLFNLGSISQINK